MILPVLMPDRIVSIAQQYIGQPFDYQKFNCVHFVRDVYHHAGIEFPRIHSHDYPPDDFHLSPQSFDLMPIGHSVFFKRRTRLSNRIWTHVAIIFSLHELIHCSRHCGSGVVVTTKAEFMEIYALSPTRPS